MVEHNPRATHSALRAYRCHVIWAPTCSGLQRRRGLRDSLIELATGYTVHEDLVARLSVTHADKHDSLASTYSIICAVPSPRFDFVHPPSFCCYISLFLSCHLIGHREFIFYYLFIISKIINFAYLILILVNSVELLFGSKQRLIHTFWPYERRN